jgi:hypothetical protein
MEQKQKNILMVLGGLVVGLLIGGLIVYLWTWRMDTDDNTANTVSYANTSNSVTNSSSATNSSATNNTVSTTSQDRTILFAQFDFTAAIPSTWQVDKKEYTTDQDGLNSELAVSGPEGSVRFIFNGDGFGGGPCAGTVENGGVDLTREVDITTKAGAVTTCHFVDENDVENWSTGGNMARTDAHYISMKGGKLFVMIGEAKAPSAKNRDVVLKVMESIQSTEFGS